MDVLCRASNSIYILITVHQKQRSRSCYPHWLPSVDHTNSFISTGMLFHLVSARRSFREALRSSLNFVFFHCFIYMQVHHGRPTCCSRYCVLPTASRSGVHWVHNIAYASGSRDDGGETSAAKYEVAQQCTSPRTCCWSSIRAVYKRSCS